MKTTKQTTGILRNAMCRDPLRVDVLAGLRVRPCEDGSGGAFVEEWRKLGLSAWHAFDAEYRGVRVPLSDCEDQ